MADPEYDGLSLVVVEAVTADIDGNIKPGNIKKGVTILGVTGTLSESSDIYSLMVFDSGTLTSTQTSNLANNEHSYVVYVDTTDPDNIRYISCLLRTRDPNRVSYVGMDNGDTFTVTIKVSTGAYAVTTIKRVDVMTDSSLDSETPTAKAVADYVKEKVRKIEARFYTKAFTKSDFTQVGEEQKYVITIPKEEHGLDNAYVLKMILNGEATSSIVYEDKTLSTGTVKIYVTVDLSQLLQYEGKIYLKGE